MSALDQSADALWQSLCTGNTEALVNQLRRAEPIATAPIVRVVPNPLDRCHFCDAEAIDTDWLNGRRIGVCGRC